MVLIQGSGALRTLIVSGCGLGGFVFRWVWNVFFKHYTRTRGKALVQEKEGIPTSTTAGENTGETGRLGGALMAGNVREGGGGQKCRAPGMLVKWRRCPPPMVS